MIRLGSKVKLNIEVLEKSGFDGFNDIIDEIEILFILSNKDTVFEVIHDWSNFSSESNYDEYRYQLNAKELDYVCFKKEELILVEVNAE